MAASKTKSKTIDQCVHVQQIQLFRGMDENLK